MLIKLTRSLRKRSALLQNGARALTDIPNLPIHQGGNIRLNLGSLKNGSVRIKSSWQDHVNLTADEGVFDVQMNEEEQKLIVSRKRGVSADVEGVIDIVTPEVINLNIMGQNTNIHIKNKIEGDVMIQCESGDIQMDKVRGKSITIESNDANISSRKLIEGADVFIKGGKIRAKMINGDNVNVFSESSIDVGAMYTRLLTMKSKKDTTLGLMNGNAYVTSSTGSVTMNNIDGWFDISANNIVNLQVNKLSRHPSSALGCRVLTKGSVFASVDPEVKASVDCFCMSTAGRAVVTIVSDSFQPLDAAPDQGLSPERAQGVLTGESKMSKRPTFSRGNGDASGKINLNGAELQAMSGPNHENRGGSSDSNADNHTEDGFDLALHAYGHVRLETLSWIEIIKRKHGFGDDEALSPPKGVGRRASSKARAVELSDGGSD